VSGLATSPGSVPPTAPTTPTPAPSPGAAFTANTHYPNGYLPSGTPVAKFTSGGNTGLYGPYTTGASNGTQTLAGFLLTDVSMARSTTSNPQGALLEHGRVILAKLPQTVDSPPVRRLPLAASSSPRRRSWHSGLTLLTPRL
jgi:hypothetical protein